MSPAGGRMVADRYALKSPLGQGGMGVVWRAQDAVLGREVAVKEVVFPPTMPEAERAPAQARVMREARAAARLNHPGAVTLYDVVRDDGSTFIVMELVDAPTLADLVHADGPLPVGRVAELGAQVAGALEAAHAAGIVHRDVKPGNVMVPERGMAKLADFGIASLQGDPQLTSTGLVIGSPAYMAPERARGEESGPPADFWALGATLFYAVEGEPPFDRGASIATLAAVVNEPPRSPRRAGPLAPLIAALLAKDPRSRPSGPELRAELARLTATPPSPPTEVLPARGPGGTAPLPVVNPTASPPRSGPGDAPDEVDEAGAAAGEAAGAGPDAGPGSDAALGAGGAAGAGPGVAAEVGDGGVDNPEHPTSGSAAPPAASPPRSVLPPAPVMEGSRRGRTVAVLALVVLGLVGVLVAVNLRSGGDRDRAAAPTTTRAGAGAARGSETTRGATSTTGAPETTAAPSTTDTAGLPEGWKAFTNRRGAYRVGVPPGFRARTRKTYNATEVAERDDPRRVFTVRSTNPSNPLPQASREYRAAAPRLFDDFREVSYEEDQTYAGLRGAVVFEYEAVREGRPVHVRHVNVKGRSWGYNIEYIVPAEQWDASQDLARQFEQAFEPLG